MTPFKSIETAGYLSALVAGQAAMLAVVLASNPRDRQTHPLLVVTITAIALNAADEVLQIPALRVAAIPLIRVKFRT